MDYRDFFAEKETHSRRKRKNDKGYIEVYLPEHPFHDRGWFLWHRLVMESYLQRFLDPASEVVHHVNHTKDDNRIENLFLCSPEEHSYIHKLGSSHTTEHKTKIRKARQKLKFKRDAAGRFIKDS